MDNEERAQKLKLQTEEIYCEIGKFCVAFEHICHAVQTSIVFLLMSEGLRNQRIAQVVVAGMTAEPLRALYESLVSEIMKLNEKEEKILKNALSRFQKITSRRNEIIHGTWFIGYASTEDTDFSEAAGLKFNRNAKGLNVNSLKSNAKDFSAATLEATELKGIFFRIHACLTFELSLEKNFYFDENGNVCEQVKS